MTQRAEITIYGKVQGVGFRYFVKDQATKLGIVGFVRNRSTNQVEIVAEGENKNLNTFIYNVKQGPSLSQVKDSSVYLTDAKNEFEEFTVSHTLY